MKLRSIKNIHLVGIGGAGMGGIAEVLNNLGYKVTGSDLASNTMTKHLTSLGIKIYSEHKAENIALVDVVVSSAAIAKDNPELLQAKKLRIPIIPRAMMLAELMRFKEGIAIAGAHGKTTTTSLVASIFAKANLDPTFVIGGKLNSAGSNAKLGAGNHFVVEACESDASFLLLKPFIAVLTNIDADHLETYGNDFNQLKQAYLDFLHNLPFYGLAVLCNDDVEVRNILEQVARPVVTYGMTEGSDYLAENIKFIDNKTHFQVKRPNATTLQVVLNLPGKHNVLNALAAIAVSTEEKVADSAILAALAEFQGVGRRFQNYQLKLEKKNITLIDDYGHHPRELAAVLATIKDCWPKRRLVMVYQPHRFTRTKALFNDFVQVLSEVDSLLLLEVYSAGETSINGADSQALSQAITSKCNRQVPVVAKQELVGSLKDLVQEDDIVLMQGAGDINKMVAELLQHAS